MIVDMTAAFLMGALSGMGIGGGGLLVIYMTLFRGVGQVEAQGLNLYFFLFASAAALFVHCVKRVINYPLVLLLGVVGIPAALLGSLCASVVDPSLLRCAFGVMLIISGAVGVLKNIKSREKIKKK